MCMLVVMSESDYAMEIHMAHLVFEEHRPFSYRDFLQFEVDGIDYKMTHGTFRNKVSKLIKEGSIELAYNSGLSLLYFKWCKSRKANDSQPYGGLLQFQPDCQTHP